MICGTKHIGQRNEEQGLIWIWIFPVIKMKTVLELLAESSAAAKSRKMIHTT
jgi:hypothetical protein